MAEIFMIITRIIQKIWWIWAIQPSLLLILTTTVAASSPTSYAISLLSISRRQWTGWKINPKQAKGDLQLLEVVVGGEAALLLAIQYPEISTVIAIVSSTYVGGAYDNKRKVSGSAWTLEGKEIPYVDYQKAVANYKPWWKILEHKEEVEPFAIPVENMSAAVLLLSGEKDAIWPSTEMSETIIRRLEENLYKFPFQHISYDAGHNIRVESWPDLLRFIQKNYPNK